MESASVSLALRPSGSPRRRRFTERAVQVAVTLVALTGLAALALIIVFIGKEAVALFTGGEVAKEVGGLGKLYLPQVVREGKPAAWVWQPVSNVPKFSMVPLLLGTLKVTAIGIVLAAPLGIGAAIYSAELAPRRVREVIKPVIELLAGIPSVVIGFFALMVLASATQDAFSLPFRLNALVAGIGIAIAIVPVIFTVSEDALTVVPRTYREAALALGATRWESTWRVVLPAAAPGVLAACMLGIGRAIGETMIVLMASGNAAIVSASVTDSTRTMSATIAAEMGEVVVGSAHYSVLFFIGVQLFAITLVLNLLAGSFVRRVVRRLGGRAG